MQILVSSLISLVLVAVSTFGFYKYVPLSVLENKNDIRLGTSLTTIAGSDTLSSSRTTINNNFTALNTGKFELSDWYATTSAPQLVSFGTITTGVWSGTAIAVAKGGTGTTSPSSNQVILGDTTSGFKVVSGFGTSGQFLTSNGVSSVPTWQTSTVNQNDNYTWTGIHTFSGATTTISSATTTITTTTGVLGFATTTPTLKSNGISIGADVYIGDGGLGIGVATTTNGNVEVSGLTYLNNLHITGTTTGGPLTYTASSTAFSVSSGTVTYTGSIPTTSNVGFGSYVAASGVAGGMQGDFTIFRVGKTQAVVGRDDDSASGGAFVYTFSWSGANFVATETTDDTSSVTGTIYWYK